MNVFPYPALAMSSFFDTRRSLLGPRLALPFQSTYLVAILSYKYLLVRWENTLTATLKIEMLLVHRV
jgi:hypothetical protein